MLELTGADAVELLALDCVDELVDELVDVRTELAVGDDVCELLAAVEELADPEADR